MNEKEYNLLDEKWVRVCDSSGNLIEIGLKLIKIANLSSIMLIRSADDHSYSAAQAYLIYKEQLAKIFKE